MSRYLLKIIFPALAALLFFNTSSPVIAKQLKDTDLANAGMNFKLTIHPAIEAGNSWEIYRFETKAELKAASETASCLLLFMQDKAKVMGDYSNMFIEEELIDGEWQEIDD